MAVAHCAPQQALRRLKHMLAFIHEHHDFFFASQHPPTNLVLRRLAAKYSMPARMWPNRIHAFLEALQYRLSGSLEHILAFIHEHHDFFSASQHFFASLSHRLSEWA